MKVVHHPFMDFEGLQGFNELSVIAAFGVEVQGGKQSVVLREPVGVDLM